MGTAAVAGFRGRTDRIRAGRSRGSLWDEPE